MSRGGRVASGQAGGRDLLPPRRLPPPDPLSPIQEDEVTLICWMVVILSAITT
ncbi:hypothetical protein SAMN06265347_108118 [Halobellus salinus]|nr:hypothetical protein SAMN06265347_108118 [Halobellus salinus]